jgi:peptide/nickel transport system substrate-binding protein
MCIYPKDALEEFGDMNDWEDSIGTGPFILTNFVSGDSLTYVRNDNYWMTNPVGPGAGDQLPYINGVLTTIVPDVTTADLLLLNGDLDVLTVTNYDRAQNMIEYVPDLNYVKYMEDFGQGHIFFNTNEAPYDDERVRWALSLAINNQQILDTVYGGEGTLIKWPIMYFESYKDAYVPLEDLEDDMITVLPGVNISVADLYGYDPDLAEDLLDAAGFPRVPAETGIRLEAKIEFYDDPGGTFRPPLEMIVAMWADVGVDLEMVALSYSEFLMTIAFRGYDDMFYGTYSGIGTYYRGINYCGDQMWNASFIDDSTAEAARDAMIAAYPDEAAVDDIHQELMPYLLGKAYVISPPTGYYYRFWWPWVRNYNGEQSVGYYNGGNQYQYVWIDEAMKEYMGYD